MRFRLLSLTVIAAILSAGSALAQDPVPIESFFRDAEMSHPSLSRDGSKVVLLVRNHPARKSIAVFDVASKRGGIVFVPNDYNVDFAFIKRDRIVFGGDAGGNESYALRSIKLDGSRLRDLSESTDQYRRSRGPVGGNVFQSCPTILDISLLPAWAHSGARAGKCGGRENLVFIGWM